ncbi:MAG: hypothetical protein IPG84_18230 [Betaproteobacteria bacterium]|nr:hypothetical protein [Betaproteobacteria bacterium]
MSEFKPPDYTQQYWENYINNANTLTDREMPRYQGQTVAPMTGQHMLGQDMLMNLAANGTASGNAANTMLYNTLQGGFDNPYATTLNPYGTESAYQNQVIDAANKKTLDAFNLNQTQNQAGHAMSRTMGSGKQMVQQQEMAKALGEGMQNNAVNALNQNYYANQGIAENQLNRATGAVDAERARQMQAAGLGGQQQGMDLQAIQALMGGGDAQRDYQQQLLDASAGDWWSWLQAPYAQQDVFGSALTRASGGSGTTSSQVMGGMNPLQAALGAGLLGLGMYGGG